MRQLLRSTPLAFALALFGVAPFAHAATLSYQSYAPAVIALQSAGIIDHPPGNDVRVRDRVNRAEALKIILKSDAAAAQDIEKERLSLAPLPLFPDMDQSAWYAPYVEVGFSRGLVKGYPDGTFRPSANVTVAEAVVMVARLYGENKAGTAFRTSDDLTNVSGEWYADAVSAMIARNAVMQGSRLRPANAMTRGELFDLVYRMRTVRLMNITSFTDDGIGPPEAPAVPTVAPQSDGGDPLRFASEKPFAISIPSIGIVDLTITHPADPYSQKGVLAVLETGVGHLLAFPGGGGKILIYGHSSGWPWDLSSFTKIFRTINKVAVGARVYITYGGKLYVYKVTAKKTVPSSDRSMYEQDDKGETLVLYTCWPPDSVQQRYLVLGEPVEVIPLK